MRKLQHSTALLMGFGLSLSVAFAAAPALKPPVSSAAIQPGATQALERMSAYLLGLPSFEINAQTVRDLVTNDGQRLQVGGVSRYKVHRPDGFQIDVDTDFM